MSENINPWLEEAIKRAEQRRRSPRGLVLIVQVDPARQAEVAAKLRELGVAILAQITGFIRVDVPGPEYIETIARIPGVIMVSYDAPVWPMAFIIDNMFKGAAIRSDPLLRELAESDLRELGIGVTAMMPTPAQAIMTPKLPPIPMPPVLVRGGVEWRLVTETRKIIEAPNDNRITSTKVAVIDSGATMMHPSLRKIFREITLVPEPPIDLLGHGQWVSTCAFGDPAPTRYGFFVPVASAPGDLFMHIKIFTAFGPTSTWHVMTAMEMAATHGARVVNMSLGGPLQGRVDQDPSCNHAKNLYKKYGTIYVVAAANDGPDKWTIASPGACPDVLTIAAIDWKTLNTSSYSSRGPQGSYYKDHKSDYQEDHEKYGENLEKPDTAAPGGDRNTQIVAGVTGWYDGFYDFILDGYEMMIGTCLVRDTIVYTPDGPVELGMIRPGDIIYSFDGEKLVPVQVQDVMNRGVKEVYEVELADGRTLIATGNHPVLTHSRDSNRDNKPFKYKRVDELTKNDSVILASSGIHTDKVVRVRPAGKEHVYDISAPPYQNFIANGIIVHNSMATPHAAGLVALLIDRGVVKSLEDIKKALARAYGEKNIDTGYGLIRMSIFRG